MLFSKGVSMWMKAVKGVYLFSFLIFLFSCGGTEEEAGKTESAFSHAGQTDFSGTFSDSGVFTTLTGLTGDSIVTEEYRFTLQSGRFHAVNRAQGLRFFAFENGEFTFEQREGAKSSLTFRTIEVRQGTVTRSLMPTMTRLGRCGSPLRTGVGAHCIERLERVANGITEWFDNRPDGLEQGFDLPEPLSRGNEPIEITVSVPARNVAQRGNAVVFFFDQPGSANSIKVHSLWVRDAAGEKREGTISFREGFLVLTVNPEGLLYPLEIDPVYSGTPDIILERNQTNGQFGRVLVGRCDVNGDGFSDLMIRGGGTTVYVYYGSSTGPIYASSLTDSAGAVDSLACGDVNGDGYDDLAVGCSGCGSTRGTVYVYHGSSSGLTLNRTILGNKDALYLGHSVAMGNLNGDSYKDLAIGSRRTTGEVWIYHGSSSGVSYNKTITNPGGFGWSVAIGDINKDGYDDLGVGAPLDSCLLYTSDAADDLLCVDLGGCRIIKKKKRTWMRSQTR